MVVFPRPVYRHVDSPAAFEELKQRARKERARDTCGKGREGSEARKKKKKKLFCSSAREPANQFYSRDNSGRKKKSKKTKSSFFSPHLVIPCFSSFLTSFLQRPYSKNSHVLRPSAVLGIPDARLESASARKKKKT